MLLLKKLVGGSKVDDSYSRDMSMSRGGSGLLNTSTVRKNQGKQNLAGNFNSYRQNIRQQVTSSLQGPSNQGLLGSGKQTGGTASYGKLLSPNSTSTERFMMSSPASSDPNSFKKRIADSVASRLSPPRQRAEGIGLMLNKNKAKDEASNDIWGIKRTNPTGLTLGKNTQSQPSLGISAGFATTLNVSRPKTGLDLTSAFSRLRSSPLRDNPSSNKLLRSEVPSSYRTDRKSQDLFAFSVKSPAGTRQQPQDVSKRLLITTPDKKASKAREILAGIGTSIKHGQNSKAALDARFNTPLPPKIERQPSRIISSLVREIHRIQSSPRPKNTSSPPMFRGNDYFTMSPFSLASNFMQGGGYSDSPTASPLRRLGRNETGFPQGGKGNTKFLQTLTVSKLQEIKDMMVHVSDKEFNELPSK